MFISVFNGQGSEMNFEVVNTQATFDLFIGLNRYIIEMMLKVTNLVLNRASIKT